MYCILYFYQGVLDTVLPSVPEVDILLVGEIHQLDSFELLGGGLRLGSVSSFVFSYIEPRWSSVEGHCQTKQDHHGQLCRQLHWNVRGSECLGSNDVAQTVSYEKDGVDGVGVPRGEQTGCHKPNELGH
jgi:hypothetical protein